MNHESQRIAIAKSVGIDTRWFAVQVNNHGIIETRYSRTIAQSQHILFKEPGKPVECVRPEKLPDYLNDLNAMHEAERALNISDEQITYWKNTLEFVCNRDNTITLMATAAQRAEAYLRTIGKWEEKP